MMEENYQEKYWKLIESERWSLGMKSITLLNKSVKYLASIMKAFHAGFVNIVVEESRRLNNIKRQARYAP